MFSLFTYIFHLFFSYILLAFMGPLVSAFLSQAMCHLAFMIFSGIHSRNQNVVEVTFLFYYFKGTDLIGKSVLYYANKTEHYRNSKSVQELAVNIPYKVVSYQTISRWITTIINLCHKLADKVQAVCHKTRF